MYIVSVTFVIKDEFAELFKEEMSRQARKCLAMEEGCLQFDVGRDPENPNRFFLYELYADQSAFDTHRQTDHFAEFGQLVKDWIAERYLATWERVEPV